eukprot:PITA_24918
MNKTLMEKERSMLSGAKLGQKFWAEVVETTFYLVNRSPSTTLEDKTPLEVWIGKKPSLSHLRIFGYDAYVHVPKEKITKLDSKSEREVKDVIEHEVLPEETERIYFEQKEEESDSKKKHESEDEETHTLAMRRSVIDRRQLERYSLATFCSNFSLSITIDDPRTVREVVDSEDGKLWKETMVDEMEYLDKNEAWDLVELLTGRKPIGIKWVFKKKMNVEGQVEKYKAQSVAKGYS